MDNVPKLLPTWHDITLQDYIRQKDGLRFSSLNPPDHGGIGLDVNFNDGVVCKFPKHVKSEITFAAHKCALPFFPLGKIKNLSDPCLKDLKKQKLDFDKFSLKLSYVRAQKKPFYLKLKALQHKINAYKAETQNKELSLRVPNSVIQLAESIPKHVIIPTFNVAYAGGTLAVCSSLENQNLLHPDRETLSKLCITPLLDGNDQYYEPDFSAEAIIELKEEPILQIESALEEFCCVRQTKSLHLVNMRSKAVFSKKTESALYHIASNPYNPIEILSVQEKGVMDLINMATGEITWSLSDDIYDPHILCPTWRCSFGSHPFSAFSLNEKKLYSIDFREKKIIAREIYSIANPSCYVDEELVGIKQWNKNPFQNLLTSSHHLIICDERYPKTPVMYWNHCLRDPPIYLECADLNSDISVIAIGTQGTQQLATFFCSFQGEIQPVSLSSPLLLSSPTDSINSLKFHCHYIEDEISARLSSPLTGVCIIPNKKEVSFTVLQSTSLGDVFYQDFKQSCEATEKTYHVSMGCVLTPPEKILPHLKELLSDNSINEDTEGTDEALFRVQINIDKVLCPPKKISADCTLCRSSTASDEKELVISQSCPMCGLNSDESQHFSNALVNNSVISGTASDKTGFLDCDVDYLSKFDDEYSKKILSVWLEASNV